MGGAKNAKKQISKKGRRGGNRSLKKIKGKIIDEFSKLNRKTEPAYEKIHLMFQDEAGFGRINKPKTCWCKKGIHPSVPCHHIREYRYAYGAVEPLTVESFFLVMTYCNSMCMNVFLEELSKNYPKDKIILVCDGAAWHKSKVLNIPENIELMFFPPYTPEINPIEQIWREIRTIRFRNEVFNTLNDVVNRLCDTISALSYDVIKSITGRDWILSFFFLFACFFVFFTHQWTSSLFSSFLRPLLYRFSQHFTDYPKTIDLFRKKYILITVKANRGKRIYILKKYSRYNAILLKIKSKKGVS